MLKTATPYMLRQDGKLFDVTPSHPYMIYNLKNDFRAELVKLINDWPQYLEFFYKNVDDEVFKNDLQVLVKSAHDLYDTSIDLSFYKDNIEEHIEKEAELLNLYHYLNTYTNQLFLKVRTSNMRFGGDSCNIYFRVSSTEFNWYPLIYNLVYENSKFISNITICNDTQAENKGESVVFYRNGRIEYNNLPVDEFLTQKGNPTVEQLIIDKYGNSYAGKLRKGCNLNEAFSMMYIGHALNIMNALAEDCLFW